MISSTSRPYFTPGKDTVPIVQEAGWVPGPVWTCGKSRPTGIRSPDRPSRSSVVIPTELPGTRYISIYYTKRWGMIRNTIYILFQCTGDTFQMNRSKANSRYNGKICRHAVLLFCVSLWDATLHLTLILRRSRTGTVWFYTSTSNKRAARPKLYTKSLTRDLKRMYGRLTLATISINL